MGLSGSLWILKCVLVDLSVFKWVLVGISELSGSDWDLVGISELSGSDWVLVGLSGPDRV